MFLQSALKYQFNHRARYAVCGLALFVGFLAVLIVHMPSAFANCSNPTGATNNTEVSTNGNVYTCDGTNWVASSAPVLLATLTANNSSSLIDTTHITSSYKSYELRLLNIVLGTNNAIPEIFVSTNGGSSYDTTSTNYYGEDMLTAAGSNGQVNFIAGLLGAGWVYKTGTSGSMNGVVRIYNPSNASVYKGFDFTFNMVANAPSGNNGAGSYIGSTAAINAFEFIPSSGTGSSGIVSGQIEIWGYP